jgi:hypothetical protein
MIPLKSKLLLRVKKRKGGVHDLQWLRSYALHISLLHNDVTTTAYSRNLVFLDGNSREHSHKVLHENIRTKHFNRTLAYIYIYIYINILYYYIYYSILYTVLIEYIFSLRGFQWLGF